LTAALDAHGKRELFAGLIAVLKDEVRKIFVTRHMATGANRDAAGQRWRVALKEAAESGTVEVRSDFEIDYVCRPVPPADEPINVRPSSGEGPDSRRPKTADGHPVGGEPPGTACAECGKSEPPVCLIRDRSSMRCEALHEHCAAAFFGRELRKH